MGPPVSNRLLEQYRMSKLYTIVVLLAIGLNTVRGDANEKKEARIKTLIKNTITKMNNEDTAATGAIQVCAGIETNVVTTGLNQVLKPYDYVHGVFTVPKTQFYSVLYMEDVETEALDKDTCHVSLRRTPQSGVEATISIANRVLSESKKHATENKYVDLVITGDIDGQLNAGDELKLVVPGSDSGSCKFEYALVCIRGASNHQQSKISVPSV